MNKISFIKSIKEIEFNSDGRIIAVKGYINRSTGDMK